MSGDAYTVVGGGAIGGTIAHSLARAGRPVTVVDSDAGHVAAIREHGLTVDHGGGRFTAVRVSATTPEEFDDRQPDGPPDGDGDGDGNSDGGPQDRRLSRVLLAVKAQATDDAMRWIAPRLAPGGYVVSVQNGFNEALVAEHVGAERTLAAFVNIFADVTAPGVIRDGGPGAFVVGEPGGAPVSERVRRLVEDLQAWGPARATDNVEGYLWAKAGFGAMLAATSLADDAMAGLIDRHRGAMYALVREVFAVAEALHVRLEPFDAFEAQAFGRNAPPAVRDAATDRLTAWLRTQPKDRSGIWRDIAVRRRPVEVTTHYATVFEEAERAGIATPVLRAVIDGLRELEQDPGGMSESRLDDLDRLAAAHNPPSRVASPAPDGPDRPDAVAAPGSLPSAPRLSAAEARSVRQWLETHREEMVRDLAAYTAHGSSSDDRAELGSCLEWLRGWLDESLGAPGTAGVTEERLEREDAGDVVVRRYPAAGHAPADAHPDGGGAPAAATALPVLLLAHYDTVWPTGTLARWPFRRDGEKITGPGVFDMKAGLVQAVWALRALDALGLPRPACTLMLNGDEETGSLASSDAIVAEASGSRAALVFEAAAGGAVKTARKGVGLFRLTVDGVEAHAGLDPAAGASAVEEAAHQVLRLGALSDPVAGTTVNVGVLHGGTRSNVTAGQAVADFDIRVASTAEQKRMEAALSSLCPVNPRTKVTVTGEWNRPVFERTPQVAHLYALARACAGPLGLDLRETSVGGASDGNFVLAAGVPVLDGLGAVGGGAHARTEHTTVGGMTERAALTAGVLAAFAG
ncbi:2-dehydropantoate 2-reductase [Streptomyces abyssalis]|uniref:2-dehydropantoate 2-reductase n=1 Tax=Streptomyces abyssalis TaxID=933944 RepID=A0A1E7JKR5_9ACTN|nr:M20/M25/M40 family metallo-hydrolase [Streptomyces abyssalis]OEU88241.1 2-dehydropantoate 2-reductase [Streptomyces abyssalis]OEU91112.1 2-dehydropantoate 2-reductase [Streptomyces abyssalis]OEV29033.1 2-dehydropantoate 2-reductase [Streptomyces nanshensis]